MTGRTDELFSPLNDDEALINYALPIVAELRANMVRVGADFSATTFNSDKSRAGAKISNAEQLRVHPAMRELSSATAIPRGGTGAVSVRLHHGGPQGAKPKAEVIAAILAGIKGRRA